MHGVVAAARFDADDPGAPPGAELRGLGCSGGRVVGVAKVIEDPSSDLRIDGQVLVAPSTNPGWVFLIVAASALVSERGSLLSHTAIIGRELGIPTVVAVKDATRLIADGARVAVDGRAGTVTLLTDVTDEAADRPPT